MNNVDRDIQRKLRALRHAEQGVLQLPTYTGDVDLIESWLNESGFSNLSMPHGAFNGKAPYEELRERL